MIFYLKLSHFLSLSSDVWTTERKSVDNLVSLFLYSFLVSAAVSMNLVVEESRTNENIGISVLNL